MFVLFRMGHGVSLRLNFWSLCLITWLAMPVQNSSFPDTIVALQERHIFFFYKLLFKILLLLIFLMLYIFSVDRSCGVVVSLYGQDTSRMSILTTEIYTILTEVFTVTIVPNWHIFPFNFSHYTVKNYTLICKIYRLKCNFTLQSVKSLYKIRAWNGP